MPYSADALDSRDEDWQIDGFDGQTHFSDDGQLYQPIDPNVSTGNSDALWVPPPGAVTNGTLRGDMPSAFDYLRVPGYAEPGHPRVFPAPKVRGIGPVISFENPYEPFPKGNSPRVKSLRERLDETIAFSDDAQGLPTALYSDFGDAGGLQEDIRTANVQQRDQIKRFAGARLTPDLEKQLGAAFFGVSQNAGTRLAVQAMNDGHAATRRIAMAAVRRALTPAEDKAILTHWQNIQRMVPGGGSSILGAVGGAIGSVGKAVGSVVAGVARPVGGLLASPIHLASDLAHGKNLLGAIKDTVKRDLGNVGAVAPYAQAVLSIVPGVGAGVNAAIAAGSAIAHGQPITDALVSGVRNMLPGGPLAQQALDTALQVAKGGNIATAALDAARAQLPGGELAKRAFDTGVALAHGANLQKTLVSQGTDLAKGKAMSFLSESVAQLSPINARVLSGQGPQFIGQTLNRAVALVPQNVQKVGQAILANPHLRSVSIATLAQRLNVPVDTARHAVASLLSSVQKAGGPTIGNMAPAAELARRLNPMQNFDQLMSSFGSRMAPIAFSPNAVATVARRSRPVAIQWLRQGSRFIPSIGEASGLDATGTAYLVEPGDSMSKIAAKLTGSSGRVGELIKANPQVKDPNKIFANQRLNLPASWMTKPSVPTQAPPMTTSASPNASTAPLPNFQAPVSAQAVAQNMPTISEQAKSSGAAVIAWQNILIRDGVAKQGTADGFFGPNTTARTKAWQAAHGLKADGVVGAGTWSKALATVPSVLAPSALPTATVPAVIQTPLGPVSLPPGLAIPAMATISENPVAQPIATNFPQLPPAPTMPVAGPGTGLQTLPPVGTTLGTTPVVTATQTGPSEVTVTQPPISNDLAPSKAPAVGGGIAMALALGALYIVGKGKLGL